MKHFLSMSAITLLILSMHSAAGPVTPDGEPIKTVGGPASLEVAEAPVTNDEWSDAKSLLEYACKGKAIVAAFAITNRETMTTKEILESLKGDWEESYEPAGVIFATYVDMQRIVNDVTRKHRDGSWFRNWEDDGEIRNFITVETVECYRNRF